MAFWKRSEDPWDIDPDQRRTASRTGGKSPRFVGYPPGDWDAMRAEWQETRESLKLPPEKCPWCGKDMEQGFLMGGRGVAWHRGIPPPERRGGSVPEVKISCGWTQKAFDYLPHGLVLPGLQKDDH